MGGGTFTGHGWKPEQKLTIPDEILMHHANYTQGIKNKIAQLKYVKTVVSKRKLVPLHPVWLSKPMKNGRSSSFPYITADTFRAYADHIIDYPFKEFDTTKVKIGDTIFVYPYYLRLFFEKIHSQIKHPYILITHNSDHSVPADDSKHYENKGFFSGNFTDYLSDEKLIAWFGRNATGKHPKLFAIPIGIVSACYPKKGNTNMIEKIRNANTSKKHLLCMNFVPRTNKAVRQPVLKLFSNKLFCYHPPMKPFNEYIQDMAASKFVLSPDGYGVECHRTWEALMVNCIPIVKSGPLDHLYDDLPVLIVDDWSIITEEFLKTKYEEFKHRTFNLEKLYIPY